jgi:uncharacterized cupredoxin-like copper-binding protein
MSTEVKHRRGTTAQHATFTGAVGEITVDTTKNTAIVHDGITAGGHPLAKDSGDATKVFNVEAATAADHAVSRSYGDTRYAALAGLATQVFNVEAATAADHAVSRSFGDTRYEPFGGSTGHSFTTSSLTVTNGISAGSNISISTSGSVTQVTSKSTTVTLNTLYGSITTHSASLAAGATVSFTVNNSLLTGDEVIVINTDGVTSSTANYTVKAGDIAAGSYKISIKNESASSLSQSIVLRFFILG